MRKIKNFRINLRIIKRLVVTAELSVEFEKAVRQCCRFYSRFLDPSVIYETFSKKHASFCLQKNVSSKWIAASIFFVTIGGQSL
jgi:hypothetical protein